MPKSTEFPISGGEHPDPDLLAAFAEGALNKDGCASLFAHAAECERCREGLRVHTQLKDFAWSRNTLTRRASGRLAIPSFRTAAGFAYAVLGIVLILFVRQNLQQQTTSSPRHWNAVSSEQRPNLRNLRFTHGQPSRGRPSRTQALSVMAGQQPAPSSFSSGQRHSSQWPHSPALWGTVRFHTLTFVPDDRSDPDSPTLPGPFASARLDLQTNFPIASPESIGREEADRAFISKQIAVKTALGERWIYLSISGADSNVIQ